VWGHQSIRGLAVIVQKRYRRLGDRLLGIVELADPAARPPNYSPELCQAAIAQVAGEASSFDFDEAAEGRAHFRYCITALVVIGVVAELFTVREAGFNALQRWLWPMAEIERYTFVTINALPDHLVVAQGEPFDISVGVASSSFWHPGTARSYFDGQSATEARITDGAATFHYPGQTQKRALHIAVGDVTRTMRIEPEIRPDLREARVKLALPDYLQYPPLEEKIEGGGLAFLPGTTATFTGEAVRELGSARLEGEKGTALAIDGSRFKTGPMLLEMERDVTFTWQDSLGLAGATPYSIHLTPREDAPPNIEVRGLEAAIGILPEETVPIDLVATDDYGVRRVAFAWQTASASPDDPPGTIHEIKVADGKPQALTVTGHYDFSPTILNIPEETTVLVRGLATDYFPSREPTSSPVYRIHVLSRESHAMLVHDQFDKMLAQLEDLTRREEGILQAGKGVRAQAPDKLAGDESAQKLAEQSGEQKENAGQLKNLASQMAAMLAEAMRNPLISADTLKEWANHVEQLNQIASGAMPTAAKSLDAARGDAGERAAQLDEALAQEQAILSAMLEMEKKGNESLESLMAQTLAARLRRAAGTEREIAGDFLKMLPDTIGMTAAELPDGAREMVESMTARHDAVTVEADRLQQEISRLFDRTNLNRYGDVAHEMDSTKTIDELTGLGKLVKQDIGVQSIDGARHWGDQFDKWADRLSASDKSQASGSPGGQGGAAAQLQALLALMRLRQAQDQLRDQTSALDEQKESNPDYASGAQDAASRQGAMRDEVEGMREAPGSPPELGAVGKSMGDAAGLLGKPETGKATTNAQTDALNLLDAVIEQEAKKSGQSAASLMAMMGMGAGSGGNGSTAGGTTDKPNAPVGGSREGGAPDERTVIQAGGIDNSALPGEFRDAIENFQHTIERRQTQ